MSDPKDSFIVMIVDDSRVSREMIIAELSHDDIFKLAVFDDPLKALEAIDEVNPDLIVSDLNMPNIDGYEFCYRVRHHPKFNSLPFVLISDTINVDTRINALEKGVTEAVTKPFKSFELFKYVSRYVDIHRYSFEYNVLLVDDTRYSRLALRKYLESLPLKIYEAADTEEAEGIIKQYPIDLIFLDHIMPGKTGIEWCKELRQTEEYKWIPILGLSSDDELALAFIESGADDYIAKKLVKEEICIRASNLLKRVLLTKELHKAVEKAETLNQQKNKLLGMAAHDIRNALTIILGYAGMILRRGKEGEHFERNMQIINNSARHTIDLLNDILDVSSIESGVVELEKTVFDLAELLKERISLMNEIGKRKNISGTLINELGRAKEVLVAADRMRMAQVIDNLLSNAIKYSEDGHGYEVLIARKVEGWMVSVKDSGQGIPEQELTGIFDEFKRSSVRTTGGEKSTGLGLAIVKKLVEIHNGTIWVDSKVGEGTTFSFIIPAYEEEEELE